MPYVNTNRKIYTIWGIKMLRFFSEREKPAVRFYESHLGCHKVCGLCQFSAILLRTPPYPKLGGGVNSRLSTTHGHITDSKL